MLNAFGKLPEAKKLIKRIESGGCAAFGGLSGVHMANLSAYVRHETGRPVFVICADELEARRFTSDFAAMTGEECCFLPSRELTFRPVEAASHEWETGRLRTLDALRKGAGLCVTSIDAVLLRTMPPQTLDECAFDIVSGKTYKTNELTRRFVAAGYSRAARVEGCGQFAIRGGILDFFSPASERPVRVDFFGDEVDSMGFFDVSTQRRTDNIKSARVIPAVETVPEAAPGGRAGLIKAIEDIISSNSRRRNSKELLKHLREDIVRLENEGHFPSADKYISQIYPPVCALDYIPDNAVIMLNNGMRLRERVKTFEWEMGEDIKTLMEEGAISSQQTQFAMGWDRILSETEKHPCVLMESFIGAKLEPRPREILTIAAKQLPSYGGSLETAVGDIRHYASDGYTTFVLASDEKRAQHLIELLANDGVIAKYDPLCSSEGPGVSVSVGVLSAGMEYPVAKLALITEGQIMTARQRKRHAVPKSNRVRIQSYTDLNPGDLVVHEQHGIGRFVGIERIRTDGVDRDYIKLVYAGTDVLFVPATQLDMVSKYIGSSGEDSPVRLNKLAGTEWHKAKTKAKSAARDMAKRLIALYAARQRLPGYAFPPDDEWQREFEDSFEYEETDDQMRCAEEIKNDMMKPHPMDRLLCGDVGFGKTEVALRAAMKCILAGKQAAMLVPTTVLAQQHYTTAMRRFSGHPLKIAMLSRFQSSAQTKNILRRLSEGRIDMVIGTHKILSKAVKFHDLGLLIVDEEQRFGVAQKEKLKELSKGVDVLTMTATPIPRTLNMALSGVRDMSAIEEAPKDRQPVQTYVLEHDWPVIADAIRREVARGGQVYYLHNRVESIMSTAGKLHSMLPDINIDVGHGQMSEDELSNVMRRMSDGEIHVLVCTTIIESGIDIPNVNTLIVEDADRLGLAQLHQIRGRVGRSPRHAYAYLTYKKGKVLSEVSSKRLSAMREFAGFGAGFKIALRDLEIRGAGNILGSEQSGHMMSVGYDMYLKLLEEAVLEEKGERVPERCNCTAELRVSAAIPSDYVFDSGERMDVYRRIAFIKEEEDARDMTDELIDRYGEPPMEVLNLVSIALLRASASACGVTELTQKENSVLMYFNKPDLARLSRVCGIPDYRGRIFLNAGDQPYISCRLRAKENSLDAARELVMAYAGTENQT